MREEIESAIIEFILDNEVNSRADELANIAMDEVDT